MKSFARAAWAKFRRPASFMLLPLSLVPLAVVLPIVISVHANYVRYYDSPPFPAPQVVLTASEHREFTKLPAFSGAIPVLAYHGINNDHDGYSISQRKLAAQMEMLRLAGFSSISIAQYDRFQHGDVSGLPRRPVLITFDDGRLDSFRGADEVLARYGLRATMFVITGQIAEKNPFYLDWTELHRMQRSGRWDIQPHAFRGHVQIAVDARGDLKPYYAMRRYSRSAGQETFADYQRRVALDLFTLADQFRQQAIDVHALAVPYGDYGQQDAGNDPRIVPFTLGLMRSQFDTVFVQDDHNDPPYTTPTGGGPQKRWEAHTSSTAEQLYEWLRARDPATPQVAHGSVAPTFTGGSGE
jgi:Polysaccharide deacetylase